MQTARTVDERQTYTRVVRYHRHLEYLAVDIGCCRENHTRRVVGHFDLHVVPALRVLDSGIAATRLNDDLEHSRLEVFPDPIAFGCHVRLDHRVSQWLVGAVVIRAFYGVDEPLDTGDAD